MSSSSSPKTKTHSYPLGALSEERLELYMEVREAVIKELMEYEEGDEFDIANLLNNLLFSIERSFLKLT